MEENRADLPENSTAETESQPITKAISLTITDQDRAAGLAAHLASLKGHLASGKFGFKYAEVFKHLFSPYFVSFGLTAPLSF